MSQSKKQIDFLLFFRIYLLSVELMHTAVRGSGSAVLDKFWFIASVVPVQPWSGQPGQHHAAGNSLIVSVQTVYTFLVAKTCLIILYLFYINTALSYINFILRIPQTTSQFKAQRNLKMQERSMQTKWNKLDFYKNDYRTSSGRWCCARVSEKSYSCQSQCLIYLLPEFYL